jgi:hypothetical protein
MKDRRGGSVTSPARLGSAVVELAGGLHRPGYHHSAAPARSVAVASEVPGGFLPDFLLTDFFDAACFATVGFD